MPRSSTRRQFLKTAAAAGVTVPYIFTAKNADAAEPKSKNDRPRIAGIGLGGRGSGDLGAAAKFGDVVAVCDVDLNHAERNKARYGGKPDVYQDYRKLLERKDIDVVINGTPDHWHTAVNIAACKAGADVYTEKPMTLTIDEGKILSKVVKETGRVVQVGTQQRSDARFQTAVELVRNGRIGKLRQVRVTLPYYTVTGGPFPVQEVPMFCLSWTLSEIDVLEFGTTSTGERYVQTKAIHARAEGGDRSSSLGGECAGLGSVRRTGDPSQSVLHLAETTLRERRGGLPAAA